MTERRYLRLRRVAALAAVGIMLVVLAPTAAGDLPCPRIKLLELGDKSARIGWTLGFDEADIAFECGTPPDLGDFGGYRLWIRDAWRVDEFELAAEFVWCEDETAAAGYWEFDPFWMAVEDDDSLRIFDGGALSNLQNAFPYEFSVTAFEASPNDSVQTVCRERNRTDIVFPHEDPSTRLRKIQAIPNPYRSSADWEYGGQRRIAFVGLPGTATIRIYTVAAAHVRTLKHSDTSSDQEFWDLKNSDNEEVAPGVYLWSVDAEGFGTAEGKIMIIK